MTCQRYTYDYYLRIAPTIKPIVKKIRQKIRQKNSSKKFVKKFVKKFTIGIHTYLKEAQESTGETISVNDYHYLGKRTKRYSSNFCPANNISLPKCSCPSIAPLMRVCTTYYNQNNYH